MADEAAKPWVLCDGGAGFIGSHTVLELVNAGFQVLVADNLVNSSEEALRRVGELTGKPEAIEFVRADMRDAAAVSALFERHPISAVIHFAALKAVGESVSKPLDYYENNLGSLFNVLRAMKTHGCRRIIFSSSATVYGSAVPPFTEESLVGVGITNPYGWTKFMAEQILRDAALADPELGVVLLRYFNPVGAHESGRIGEDPQGMPNNLMPYVLQVAVGRRPHLTVHGGDYATPDGTALRDYIHVVDLAKGHVAALQWIERQTEPGCCETFNLGTGTSTSVLDVVRGVERASGRPVPYVVGPRRPGDLETCFAKVDKAERVLGWKAERDLDAMCADGWRWQMLNPMGFHAAKEAEEAGGGGGEGK